MANSAWGIEHGEISKAMSQEMKDGRRANRKVVAEHQRKGANQGALIGLGAGAAVGASIGRGRGLAYGVRAAGRLARRGDGLGNAAKGGVKMYRAAQSQRRIQPDGLVNIPAGISVGAIVGNDVGNKRGAKRALKDPRYDHRYPVTKGLLTPSTDKQRKKTANKEIVGGTGLVAGGLMASNEGGKRIGAGINAYRVGQALPMTGVKGMALRHMGKGGLLGGAGVAAAGIGGGMIGHGALTRSKLKGK